MRAGRSRGGEFRKERYAGFVLGCASLTVADIDLWEVRDSFSAITLHYIDTLGIDLERFNVNGSSIALGHPMGATGAMLVSCLLDEMQVRGARYGVAPVPSAPLWTSASKLWWLPAEIQPVAAVPTAWLAGSMVARTENSSLPFALGNM